MTSTIPVRMQDATCLINTATCSLTCQNGGTCYFISDTEFARCHCRIGYTGRYCQQQGSKQSYILCITSKVREFKSCFAHACLVTAVIMTCSPFCMNGGTCRTNSSNTFCECPSGYTGSYCQKRGTTHTTT